MNDILVIRAPFHMKKEAMQRTYDYILEQMESGLVLLPAGFSVVFCPPDIEVKFIDSNNDIVLEQEPYENIPFLLHKKFGCPLDECVKAYEKANEYLRSKSKLKG